MKLPNFLVIGAAKSGTISLYHYLKQHPQIYMCPVMEPKFFHFTRGNLPDFQGIGDMKANSHVITNLESYAQLFEDSDSKTQLAIGESSPSYLYCQDVPENIKTIIPNVKIIAVLRHPVERAYSNYLHLFASGREPIKKFEDALQAEQERIEKNWEYFWHYKNQGFYYQHLKRYFDTFERKQIKIYLYDNYCSSPQEMLQNMFDFIGVDSQFVLDFSEKYNETSFVKSSTLFTLMKSSNSLKSIIKRLLPSDVRSAILNAVKNQAMTHEKPKLVLGTKEFLLNEYRQDILNLQDLIEQDLSHWLDISKINC